MFLNIDNGYIVYKTGEVWSMLDMQRKWNTFYDKVLAPHLKKVGLYRPCNGIVVESSHWLSSVSGSH